MSTRRCSRVDAGGLLVMISLGAAVLALWSYLRWPGAAPASIRGAVVRVVLAFALLQIGVVPLGAADDTSLAFGVFAVVGVIVPLLTLAFLSGLWVMRLFADMLRGYV
jgi:hypothetical protein